MKKILFVFATAALFAACSQNDAVAPVAQQNADDAISFSAYTTTAVTRGTVNNATDFQTKGIGVFAFYQPAVNGASGADFTTIKYPTPDYMYNQQITFATATKTWSYTPVKYWPNNTGDKLSFFAYAPYEAGTTWEDLGITTDATGKTITKTFDIYNAVADQKDYLFAEPKTNLSKPTGASVISTDGLGTAKTDPVLGSSATTGSDVVRFDFKHVTSKVNLYVGVNTDVNTPSTGSQKSDGTATAGEWKDGNTVIEIKSIEFKDLAQTLTWTSSATNKWSIAGQQDIKVVPSATDNADKIDATNWATAKWHRVLTGNLEDSTSTDEYMFIAPQEVDNQEIVITYVVKTTDSNLHSGKSEITNVITKKWTDFKNDNFTEFEAGKQYRLYFMIGMQSVKVAATITGWEDATHPESVIDVPAANAN